MAAPLPPAPDLQESPGVQLVRSCYNKGPYASKAEASTVADDAVDQGRTATVTKTSDGWMVKVCKK
ncbi:MAG: hypothetical protein AB7F74_12945 [Parvibaculaceae bacterium]